MEVVYLPSLLSNNITHGVWMIIFWADLLEMLQIVLGIEGGHLPYEGHFGFNYSKNNRKQGEVSKSDPEYTKS